MNQQVLKNINRSLHNAVIDAVEALERKRMVISVVPGKGATDKSPAGSVSLKVLDAPINVKEPEKVAAEQLVASAAYFNENGKGVVVAKGLSLSVGKEEAVAVPAPEAKAKKEK